MIYQLCFEECLMTEGNKDIPSCCFMIWGQLKNCLCDYEGCESFLLLVTKGKQISILEVKSQG